MARPPKAAPLSEPAGVGTGGGVASTAAGAAVPTAAGPLRADLDAVVARLRAALAGLFESLDLDPRRPQAVSRALGLDKTLTWKLSRLIGERDALGALGFVPGPGGWQRLWDAAARASDEPARLDEARRAADDLKTLVRRHAGSRTEFARLLAGLDAERSEPRLYGSARRQAFEGNAAIWGVQAAARIGLHAVAPSVDDPSRLDLATVGGLVGLQRLRASSSWPIVRHVSYEAPGATPQHRVEPLDRDLPPDQPPLLRRFCSPNLPPLDTVDVGGSKTYALSAGPIGRTGAVTCLFGFLDRRFAPDRAATEGELGEHLTLLNTPVERALVDLCIHRSLGDALPELQLVSAMESLGAPITSAAGSRSLLPTAETVERLDGTAPLLETPLLPRHRELVGFVLERLGHPLADFHVYRVELAWPPIPTTAILRWPLPHA
jgi:hypothetical protein